MFLSTSSRIVSSLCIQEAPNAYYAVRNSLPLFPETQIRTRASNGEGHEVPLLLLDIASPLSPPHTQGSALSGPLPATVATPSSVCRSMQLFT